MDVTSVTLDEVLIAAEKRAASLVPETAGYLALAVADASARLPFRLDDELVTLTTEGTVNVARGSVVVPPEESARLLRRVLARLLERSVGSMPGLAAAARAREEQAEGAGGIVRDLESALVPVNRAAARRALARLARETARARDLGKLRRRARRADPARGASTELARPAATPRPATAPGDVVAARLESPSAQSASSAPPAEHAQEPEPSVEVDVDVALFAEAVELAAPAEPTPTELGTSVVEATDPFDREEELAEATVVDTVMAERLEQAHEARAEAERAERLEAEVASALAADDARRTNAPRRTPRDEARVVLAPELASKRGRGFPSQREARIDSSRSDVDSLLASFAGGNEVELEHAEGLARSVGLELTPPGGARRREPTPRPPSSQVQRIERAPEPIAEAPEAPIVGAPALTKPRSSWAGWFALLALGLVAAGLLGHYAPGWIEPSDQAAVEPR